MAGDEERLVVLLEARVNAFEREFKRAENTSTRGFDRMRRGSASAARQMENDMVRSTSRINQALAATSAKVGSLGKEFALGLAGGVVAGGIAGMVSTLRDVAKGIATVGDEAKKAGLSTKAFQELKYVAEQSRIGVDALTDGMKELSLRADEFITTGAGSAAEAFQRLGYTAADLKQKLRDPAALFEEIIGKLEKLDRASRIRIMDELFGGTGGEMFVQLVDKGAAGIKRLRQEAHETASVMTDEMIAAADKLDQSFNRVATTVGNALKGAVVAAASALQEFLALLEQVPGFRSQEATDRGIAAIQNAVSEQAVNDQREGHLRRIRDLQATITKNNDLGFDNADAQKALLAEQTRLRALDALIERQRTLNEEKEKTAELDTVVVEGEPRSSIGGRTRYRQFGEVALPGSVGTTPERRVDPYFEDPSSGASSASTKAATDSAVVTLIKGFEGYISKAKWDVNHFRVGYGSDTTTRADGSIEKVTASTTVTLADATRDLARRITEFQSVIKGQIGGDTWASFSEEQQAALTSVAYNYGELPDRIVKVIESGNPQKIGDVIARLGNDNNGVNMKRRQAEADLFASGSSSSYAEELQYKTQAVTQANQNLQNSYTQLQQIGVGALQSLVGAMADGKLEGRELLGILANVVQQLLSMPGAANGLGSILSSIFGGGKSSFTPNTTFASVLGVPGFAKGTRSAPGGLAITGEKGPELVNLPRGAQVTPADQTARLLEGSGGDTNSFTFAPSYNVQGGTSEEIADLRRKMDKDRREFEGRVLNTVSRGQKRRLLN